MADVLLNIIYFNCSFHFFPLKMVTLYFFARIKDGEQGIKEIIRLNYHVWLIKDFKRCKIFIF
jgi:hypothetical protein